MKKFRSLLLLPLLFTLGACATDENNTPDLSDKISNIDPQDIAKNFIYENGVASRKLKELAEVDGYSFDLRVEHEVLPDNYHESVYFNIELNGKDNVSWATVEQVDEDDNVLATYEALLEEDSDKTFVKNGTSWTEVNLDALNIPYSISDIKDLLIVSGQYLPLLAMTGVIKTRIIEINRECIKYKMVEDKDELTIVVDRATQIMTHFTQIEYINNGVSKNLMRMDSFNESAPSIPEYK